MHIGFSVCRQSNADAAAAPIPSPHTSKLLAVLSRLAPGILNHSRRLQPTLSSSPDRILQNGLSGLIVERVAESDPSKHTLPPLSFTH